MITLHPYKAFTASVSILDSRVLVLLMLECVACLEDDRDFADPNMFVLWENHKPALAMYTMLVCLEIERRELNVDYLNALHVAASFTRPDQPAELPWFAENKEFNDSHKSLLLRDNPSFYDRFGWQEFVPVDLPLFFTPKED